MWWPRRRPPSGCRSTSAGRGRSRCPWARRGTPCGCRRRRCGTSRRRARGPNRRSAACRCAAAGSRSSWRRR
ncbi:hypothetical protein DVA86_04815 [Streptomyces armeniacus]|uniref:Uncharacterized protein n=1 Tax=Streptomyces armeniacus TaxID=83291 RepID=A0A345XZM6_9ACTN|nr:hypothetical protein DVA86_04815 [Streptomyces armeniacus]